jgi:hypothetical protein
MDVADLLLELYGRIPPLARQAVEGVELARLTESPARGTNHIAWLLWHLARVQDVHIAEILEAEQVWTTGDWPPRFGLGADASDTGFGHTSADVSSIRPESPAVLLDYLDAVDRRTRSLLVGLSSEDLNRIVDRRWNPPVTLGVRLVSVADDCLEHVGQAAYVRGLLGV